MVMGKYLVTGGCGFIGSNIAERLAREGHEVVVIDDLSTGSNLNFNGRLIPMAIQPGLAHFSSEGDKLTGIFHLGIPSSSPLYRDDHRLVGKAISEFVDLMEFAREKEVRVVYASSSSIYNGNPTPWREDMPVYATDFYTEVRQSIERLARLYHGFHGVSSVGIRPFSVYGPKEKAKGKFANLVTQAVWAAADGDPFVIYGDGNQSRDFTFVADTVDAFIIAMSSDISCEVFNAGTGKSYALNEVLDLLESLGLEIKRSYIKNPIRNYVQDTLADISKAEATLGFRAKYSLREGIEVLVSGRVW